MSANDYLAELQKQLATRWFDFSEDAVRRYLERQRPDIVRWHPKLADEDINRQVKKTVSTVARTYGPFDSMLGEMKTKFLRACSAGERQKIKNIPVGSMFTDDPNGWVIRGPNDNLVVGIHTGILHLCYWTGRLLASLYVVGNGGTRRKRVTASELDSASRKYFNSCVSLLTNGEVLPGDVHNPLNAAQMHFASWIIDSMEVFVLAHEFGHICLGHLAGLASPPFAPQIKYYVSASHQQEFDADEWAQRRMLWVKDKSADFFRKNGWLVNGPIVAMSALLALEEAAKFLPEFLESNSSLKPALKLRMSSETHPPTKSRRDHLLACFANHLSKEDSDYLQAKEHAQMLDDVVGRFENVLR